MDIIVAMFLCLGCDVEESSFKTLYSKVFGKEAPTDGQIMNRDQFLALMNEFVSQLDPVDGVISTLQEKYDQAQKGKCTKADMIKFMNENNWLEGDRETILKILEEFVDSDSNIDYSAALKKIVQD